MTISATRQQRRARTLDDPRFERFRHPRARRLLASLLLGLLVAEAALFVALDHATWPALVGLAVVLVAFVGCLGTLKASTRGVEELPEAVLDERQWELRGRIFATSYRVGSALLIAGLATVALWAHAGPADPGRRRRRGRARRAVPGRARAPDARRRAPRRPLLHAKRCSLAVAPAP